MKKEIVKILDYSEYPGPRYITQGLDSAEQFYYDVLKKPFENAIKNNFILVVDLDNTAGYAPSFIDEIFGNLVYDFDFKDIPKHLEIKSNDEPDWKDLVKKNILKKWKQKKDDNQPRKPIGF